MQDLITHFGYIGVTAMLLTSGLGLPLPEDIPLLTGGYLCGIDRCRLQIMIPLTLGAVLLADSVIYLLGRRYGHHVPRLPLVRRYLTEKRLARAERAFHDHGGKTLFTARFLPGLRAPAFFTAGVFKIPFWKFLAIDGAAAFISVPVLVYAGYWGAARFDQVKRWAHDAQLALAVGIVIVVGLIITWKMRRRRKIASAAEL